MREPVANLRYQSGASVLELRLKARGAVHYYCDELFVTRFESLEDAFANIHTRTLALWPPHAAIPPEQKSDWIPVYEKTEQADILA